MIKTILVVIGAVAAILMAVCVCPAGEWKSSYQWDDSFLQELSRINQRYDAEMAAQRQQTQQRQMIRLLKDIQYEMLMDNLGMSLRYAD